MPTEQWREENKELMRAYRRKWYKRNKEKGKASTLRRRQKLVAKMRLFKSERGCACGERHPACLHFHHKDKNQKVVIITRAVINGWSWERIEGEIRKCVVMCANCHAKLHYAERIEKHGVRVPPSSNKVLETSSHAGALRIESAAIATAN